MRGLRRFLFFMVWFIPAQTLAAGPHWTNVASSHFLVLTNGDEKQGREVAVRFEQMRAVFGQLLARNRVNLPLPIDIIALKSDDDFAAVAPSPGGKPIFEAAFAIPEADREFFVLDLAESDGWRAISRQFGVMLLNYNYPPTQPWFDEGFAEYFSSLRLDGKQMRLGEDPESNPAVRQSLLGKPSGESSRQPLVEQLSTSPWLPLTALFSEKPDANHTAMFTAQSWMTMHYLINKNKLAETGNYFGFVKNQKLPVEEAIQKAYGMTPVQLDQAIKDYFHSLTSAVPIKAEGEAAPLGSDDVGVTTTDVPEATARSRVAEMQLRLPDRHDAARQVLESIASQPATDNSVVHRAVGWDHLMKNEYDPALEEFKAAEDLDKNDMWPHYYRALTQYREAEATGKEVKGLANMMQDLHQVLEKWTECAEAYFMLGWAQRQGGGIHAAMDTMPAAIRLAPRNRAYLLEMARLYEAAKDWDAATALLETLSSSSEPEIAAGAQSDLRNMAYIKKYGIAPAPGETAKPANAAAASTPKAASTSSPPATVQPASAAANKSNPDLSDELSETSEEPVIDKRPIRYLKGKVVSVDCSHAPGAIVIFSSGAKTLRLKTPDYKSLALIGADAFSCGWSNRAAEVNYKAGTADNGDLVSLEVK